MSSRKSRAKPYDSNNPGNWTAAQLRTELAQEGLNFTSSVSRAALKQIYDQMSNSNNSSSENHDSSARQSELNDNVSSQTVQSRDNTQDNLLTAIRDTPTGQKNDLTANSGSTQSADNVTSASVTSTSGTCVSSNNDVSQVLVQNTLGLMTSMQTAISSLQSTVNTLINKQSVMGLDTKNNLDTIYNSMPVTREQHSAQPASPIPSQTNNGVEQMSYPI